MASETAKKIVAAIIDDMTDRGGLRQGWDMIDGDIQDEIRDTWADKVDAVLEEGK